MASKAVVQRFDKIDKSRALIPVGHTRTGACTSRGRCFHKVLQGRPKVSKKTARSK